MNKQGTQASAEAGIKDAEIGVPHASASGALKLGVFGGSEFTLGFELAGINTIISTNDLDENERHELLFNTLKRSDIGVLIADERALIGLSSTDRMLIENYIRPVVIVLSETASDTGSLRRQILRAIGVDVYNERP
jgi:vacuolar-type H+-ATPase subunit F/Vma7